MLAAALDADDAKHFADIGIEAVEDSFGDGIPLAREALTELGVDQATIEEWIAMRKEAVSDDIHEAA